MKRALALPLIVAAAPAASDPTPYDGLYRQSVTVPCDVVTSDGGAIRIEDAVLTGVDSRCEMENPVDVREMDATLYDMECAAADTEWRTRAFLGASATGGLIIVLDGHAFHYDRCSPDDPVGAVTLAPVIGIESEPVPEPRPAVVE